MLRVIFVPHTASEIRSWRSCPGLSWCRCGPPLCDMRTQILNRVLGCAKHFLARWQSFPFLYQPNNVCFVRWFSQRNDPDLPVSPSQDAELLEGGPATGPSGRLEARWLAPQNRSCLAEAVRTAGPGSWAAMVVLLTGKVGAATVLAGQLSWLRLGQVIGLTSVCSTCPPRAGILFGHPVWFLFLFLTVLVLWRLRQKWPMALVTWQGEVSADHWLRLPHSRVQLVEAGKGRGISHLA